LTRRTSPAANHSSRSERRRERFPATPCRRNWSGFRHIYDLLFGVPINKLPFLGSEDEFFLPYWRSQREKVRRRLSPMGSKNMSASAPISCSRGNCLGGTFHADGLATPLLQRLVAANRTFIWYEKQAIVHCFGSFAWRRRSPWGSARGWPVFSPHISPGAAPHIGQGTERICLGLNSLIMCGDNASKRGALLVNCVHAKKNAPFGKRGANDFTHVCFVFKADQGVFDADPRQAP